MEDYTKIIGKVVKIKTKSNEIIQGVVYGYYWELKLLYLKPTEKIQNQSSDDLDMFKINIEDSFIIVNIDNIISIKSHSTEGEMSREQVSKKVKNENENLKNNLSSYDEICKVYDQKVEGNLAKWKNMIEKYKQNRRSNSDNDE